MEMNQLQNSLIYGKVMWFERGFCLRAAPVALLGDLSGAASTVAWLECAWEPIMVQ